MEPEAAPEQLRTGPERPVHRLSSFPPFHWLLNKSTARAGAVLTACVTKFLLGDATHGDPMPPKSNETNP